MAEKIDRAELERALREMRARDGKKPVSTGKLVAIIAAVVFAVVLLFVLFLIYDQVSGNADERNEPNPYVGQGLVIDESR